MNARPEPPQGKARTGELEGNGLVERVMHRQYPVAGPQEHLEGVVPLLQNADCRSMPVVRDGKLLGMVTLENVGEFIQMRSALHGTGV